MRLIGLGFLFHLNPSFRLERAARNGEICGLGACASYHASMRELNPCCYIMASRSHTLYVGVTSDIYTRVMQHRNGAFEGFTSRYKCDRLVFCEFFETMAEAITREKQLKRWRHEKKVWLIEKDNPAWVDLSEGWSGPIQLYSGD